jgi:hypothetical protein
MCVCVLRSTQVVVTSWWWLVRTALNSASFCVRGGARCMRWQRKGADVEQMLSW